MPPPELKPPEPAWAVAAAAIIAPKARRNAHRATRSGRANPPPAPRAVRRSPALRRALPSSMLFRSLTGLADGLAPKEMALRGDRRDSPQVFRSPDPAYVGRDSAKVAAG